MSPPRTARPLGATPVLPVRDVGASVDRYRRLGFDGEADGRDPIRHGYLSWGGTPVLLIAAPDLDPATNTAGVFLTVDDARALHHMWRTTKVGGRLSTMRVTDIGTAEFYYEDPDGNTIRIGAPAERPP